MGRILSIDYGEKRTGLAVTDTLKIIANPLTTVPTVELMHYITNYIAKEDVESVVIGFPKQSDNTPSSNMSRVEAFAHKFETLFPDLPLIRYDERYTTILAHRAIIMGGVKKKQRLDKGLADRISAVIILQSYLESIQYKQL